MWPSMNLMLAVVWPQPLAPVHSTTVSAAIAAVPLAVVLVLMGVLRKSGLLASACGLLTALALAVFVWGMPAPLASWTLAYGALAALWSILWIVFNALWLYQLTADTGKFDLLRRWVQQHASADPAVQAIVVAFCLGALLEGSAGFGAPVAITAFLLVQLGFPPRRAITVSLLANTAPVAFGALGIPVIALAAVTGLELGKLSAMIGRQLPFLSFVLPAYLAVVIGGFRGLRRTWPAALVAGTSFATAQFFVSNFWGPYATDIIAAVACTAAVVAFLRVWKPPAGEAAASTPDAPRLSVADGVAAWLPWAMLSAVVVLWSYFRVFQKGAVSFAIPRLHNGVLITLYNKPYPAVFSFQPLAVGTAVLVATLLTALCFRVPPRVLLATGGKALLQLRLPGLTVLIIVALAYLYNYSGMAYTVGAAVAGVGPIFPLLSAFLGWLACFLSGSDTASNLLFGNLQVAAANKLQLSPVLLAATNSSGAVAGKMISPQNIAVGVTTVGLIGEEGSVLHSTFWHSVLFAALIGLVACAQAYLVAWMVP
jgi:lactate permease